MNHFTVTAISLKLIFIVSQCTDLVRVTRPISHVSRSASHVSSFTRSISKPSAHLITRSQAHWFDDAVAKSMPPALSDSHKVGFEMARKRQVTHPSKTYRRDFENLRFKLIIADDERKAEILTELIRHGGDISEVLSYINNKDE